MNTAGDCKSDRRLSLPVYPHPLDYRDPSRTHPSIMGEHGPDDHDQPGVDERESPEGPPAYHRRRTFSTSDVNLNYCIPEIVIDEAPPAANSHDSMPIRAVRPIQRLSYKMDHLRIGDIIAEQANQKEQHNSAVLMKRHSLANEQITKPSQSTTANTNRRRSVPNLKSVVEEEQEDE